MLKFEEVPSKIDAVNFTPKWGVIFHWMEGKRHIRWTAPSYYKFEPKTFFLNSNYEICCGNWFICLRDKFISMLHCREMITLVRIAGFQKGGVGNMRPPCPVVFWPTPTHFLADFDKIGVKLLRTTSRFKWDMPLRFLKHHPFFTPV